MTAISIALLCIVILLIAIVTCCCGGYVDKKEDESSIEHSRPVESPNNDTATTAQEANAVENELVLRTQIIEALFPQRKASTFREGNDVLNSEDAKCAICLEPFVYTDETTDIVTGQCSHGFHRGCIIDWLNRKDHCPECRQQMWESQAYQAAKEEILLYHQQGQEQEEKDHDTV